MAFSIAEGIWDEGQYSYAPFIQVPPSLPCHGFEPAGLEQLPSQSTLPAHPQPDPYYHQTKTRPPMTGEAAPATWFDIDVSANPPPPAVPRSLPLTEPGLFFRVFHDKIQPIVRHIKNAKLAEASETLISVSRWLVGNLNSTGITILALLDRSHCLI